MSEIKEVQMPVNAEQAKYHEVILSLGSNVEPRIDRICDAIRKLNEFLEISVASPAKESNDITGRGEPYLNMALRGVTGLDISNFLKRIAEIETSGGRHHIRSQAGMVDIDIDLIVWDDEIISPDDFSRPYFIPLFEAISECKAEA